MSNFFLWINNKVVGVLVGLYVAAGVLSSTDGTISLLYRTGVPTRILVYIDTIFWIFFFLLIGLLVYAFYQLHKTRNQLRSGRKSESQFRLIGLQNAECDRDVLKVLESSLAKLSLDQSSYDHVKSVYTENIQSLLNLASIIFTEYTGIRCSTSIRILGIHERDVNVSRTVMRNRESGMNRGLNVTFTSTIHDNTANVEILQNGRPYFASNDLKKDRSDGHYINTRPGWDKDYTSTIVRGIPHLGLINFTPDLCQTVDLSQEATRPSYIGLFCVDSKGGKLNDDACISYSQEISWRIGTALFAINLLDKSLSDRKKASEALKTD